jgi:hypothetical protein
MRRLGRKILRTTIWFALIAPVVCLDLLWPGTGEPASDAPASRPDAPAKPEPPAKPTVFLTPEFSDAASPLRPEPGKVHAGMRVFVPALPRERPPVSWAALEDTRKIAVDGVIGELPAEVKSLDGRQVTLSGYLVIPFAAEPLTEFYLCRNPWDGCCIGKPPTVFNSVAVRLGPGARLADPRRWVATLTGTFRAGPAYDEEGRLTALFSLTEAREARPGDAATGLAVGAAGASRLR